MSKNKKAQAGQKRHAKAVKRKNKSMKGEQLPPNSLAVLLKKAKYAAVNGVAVGDTDVRRDVEHVKQAKKHLGDVYNYFNYLVFTKQLVDNNVIIGLGWNIDLIELGKQILNLNHRIKVLPLLDEDDIYATELYSIGSAIQDLALIIIDAVTKTEPYQNIIYRVMIQCGDTLPPKDDGTDRTPDETINDVLKISGENFFYTNFHKEEKTSETV